MALSGSSIPLDNGGFVTTVICPNHYSHQRLMQAINGIVPDAGTSERVPSCGGGLTRDDGHGNTAAPPSSAEMAAAELRERAEQDDGAYDVSADPTYSVGGTD